MKANRFIFLILILFGSTLANAQDGFALFKNGLGAKQVGMGEAVVSVTNYVNGSSYNPSAIGSIKNFTASFGHTKYWDNINLESGFYAVPLSSKINLHGGIRYATVDKLEKRNETPSTEPIAEFDFHDISFKTGISYISNEKLTLGFAFGWFFEKNERWKGSAFNIDLGAQYKVSQNFKLGASVTNLGSSTQITTDGDDPSDEISLPTRYSVGGNYTYDKYIGALDLVILDDDLKIHSGAETQLHELLDVRAGYMLGYDSKNFTTGVTFTKRNIIIDYAFVPYSHNLGSTHLFNFTFSI